MIPQVTLGKTGLLVSRLCLGGYPFGGVNRARDWDPFSPSGREQAITTVQAALDAGMWPRLSQHPRRRRLQPLFINAYWTTALHF